MEVNNKCKKHYCWVAGFSILAVVFLSIFEVDISIRDKIFLRGRNEIDLTDTRTQAFDNNTKMIVKGIKTHGQIVEKTAKITEKLSQSSTKAAPEIKNNSNRTKTPTQCYNEYLGPTRDDDLAKIESYTFKGIESYIKGMYYNKSYICVINGMYFIRANIDAIKELFPFDSVNAGQEYPTFVSGFSSNHFKEGLVMLDVLNETVRTKYKDVKVIVFDLGLSEPQLKQLNTTHLYEVKKFNFEDYPEHFKQLHNFAWKAIAIQIVAREYPFVVWMDTSIRFKTSKLDELFQSVRENGLLVTYEGESKTGTIAERTHLNTFEFLDEKPCTYALHHETKGGFIMLYADPFITKYFLYPFVACALNLGCMEPFPKGSNKFLSCPAKKKELQFHLCHRSDQSIIGILFHRLFHFEPDKHKIDFKYFAVCRNQKRIC